MSLRVCLDCTTAFAVGAPRCPHCGSERHAEQGSALALGIQASVPVEEEHMPKITRHGGPSIAGAEPARVEGGEDVSAGSSGETSSEKPSTTPVKSGTTRRSRARKTGNRSSRDQAESSTAASTATSGPETDVANQ